MMENSNPELAVWVIKQRKKFFLSLLKEFIDVFAWSYQDMPGIYPEIVQHRIPTYPDAKPVKQKERKVD